MNMAMYPFSLIENELAHRSMGINNCYVNLDGKTGIQTMKGLLWGVLFSIVMVFLIINYFV